MNNTPVQDPQIQMEKTPYAYYESVVPLRVLNFYISEALEEPSKYIDMIHRIKSASPNDIIYFYLNTPGGRLDTTIQIINAMRISQAQIVTVLEAEAHSAGTLLFLCGDEFIVNDNCMMMFHNYSGGALGKGNEMKLQVDATAKWFNKMAQDIYYPFLSHAEISDMIQGKDIWMDSEEIRKRLKKMVKVLTKERKEAIKRSEQEETESNKKGA